MNRLVVLGLLGLVLSAVYLIPFWVGAALLVAVIYEIYDIYKERQTRSLVFVNASKLQELTWNQQFGVPFSQYVRRYCQFNFLALINTVLKLDHDICQPGRDLIKEDPKSFFGPLLVSQGYISMGNTDKAHEYYDQAKKLAFDTESKYNASLIDFFPNEPLFFDLFDTSTQRSLKKTILKEVVKDQIWIICGLFKMGTVYIDHLTTMVKLSGGDNKVILINPQRLDDDLVSQITGQLGFQVEALITTCAVHGKGLKACSEQFPSAKLHGNEPNKKHDQPKLSWTGFIRKHDSTTHPYANDLQYHFMSGSMAGDMIIFHKATRTCIGPVDAGMPTDVSSFGMKTYLFGLGVYKGKQWHANHPMGVQSYNYLLTTNVKTFGREVQKIIDLNADRCILGHGSLDSAVIEGKDQVKKSFEETYNWALLSSKPSSSSKYSATSLAYLNPVTLWYFRIAYLSHHYFLRTLITSIISKFVFPKKKSNK